MWVGKGRLLSYNDSKKFKIRRKNLGGVFPFLQYIRVDTFINKMNDISILKK